MLSPPCRSLRQRVNNKQHSLISVLQICTVDVQTSDLAVIEVNRVEGGLLVLCRHLRTNPESHAKPRTLVLMQ